MGVSVRHNAKLAALVALAAAVMTVAWFARALQTGSWLDWVWCVVVAAIALLLLFVVRDGRAPLLVADEHGVRVRRGQTWSGMRWPDIAHVEVRSPGRWLRDGQIVVHPLPQDGSDGQDGQDGQDGPDGPVGLGPAAEGRADASENETAGADHPPHHEPDHHEDRNDSADQPGLGLPVAPGLEPYVVPLGRTTRVEGDGLSGDLLADLESLANGRVPVLVHTRPLPGPSEKGAKPEKVAKTPRASRWRPGRNVSTPVTGPIEDAHVEQEPVDPEGVEPGSIEQQSTHQVSSPASSPAPVLVDAATASGVISEAARAPEVSLDPVQPARVARPAARAQVLRESVRRLPATPAVAAQRADSRPVLVAQVPEAVDTEPRAAADPMIGPLVAAARHRARLSIDTLSDRTRIRPHVLECIEVDDFDACGGDFYARGHLRTLARVFGLDADHVLGLYDTHYAKAEIEARQVFEAELASGIGGGVRAAHTGPRWSLLAGCVVALVAVWGVAQVFNDTPQELVSPAPEVVDSAGLATAEPPQGSKMTLAPLEISALGASPQVVVRDRDGRIRWAGKLAEGQRQQVIGLAPFDVTASNGGAVEVAFLGRAKGTVGDSEEASSRKFG